MEKVIKNGKMERNISENLLMVKKKEKGKKIGQMDKNMKENLNLDINMEKGNVNFQVE